MYKYAIARLQQAGMLVATVSTDGDFSHAPARRAYQKAGFHAQISSVWLDPVSHRIGNELLSNTSLQAYWMELFDLPVMP